MSDSDLPKAGEKFVSFRRHAKLPDVFYALTASGASWMFTSTGPFHAGVPCDPSDAGSIANGLSLTPDGWKAVGFPDRAPRLIDVVVGLAPKTTEDPGPERCCENCGHWLYDDCTKEALAPKHADTKIRAAACGYWDPTALMTVEAISMRTAVAPIPENPVAAVEDDLRTSTMRQAKDSIGKLGVLLDMTPAAAVRALHLIGETAAVYGEMLAALGVPGVARKRGLGVVGQYAASASTTASLSSMETMPGGETYGNQALGQFNAGLKQIVELAAGRKDKPRKPHGPTAFDIESLTRAYGNAKRENLDDGIVAKLKSRLEEALATQEWGPASGVDPDDLSADPLPVAPLLEGVARGVAAGAGLPVADEDAT